MRWFSFIFMFLSSLSWSQDFPGVSFYASEELEPYTARIDTVVLGDLNFDNIQDTAIIYSPIHNSMGCQDSICQTRIDLSFIEVDLTFNVAIGCYHIWNASDLDQDGICEIAVVGDWFTSCWSGIRLYSFKQNKWQKLGSVPIYKCVDTDDLKWRVKAKDTSHFEMVGEISDPEDWKKDSTWVFDFNPD